MADYYTQLVVQQNIPLSLISPFEKLLLGAMLEHEQIDDEMYFFASEQVCDFPDVLRRDLQEALAASPQRSRLRAFAEKALAASNPDYALFRSWTCPPANSAATPISLSCRTLSAARKASCPI